MSPMLGLTISLPQSLLARAGSDLAAIERLIRVAPGQIERALELAEEIVAIGHRVLEIGERLDQRAATIEKLGERLEARAESIGRLGERLDDRAASLLHLGGHMETVGGQIDHRGAEIVAAASQVSDTARDLLLVLPTLERALDLATPLEGAIDRFGRLVDRFPGASSNRRRNPREIHEPDEEEQG